MQGLLLSNGPQEVSIVRETDGCWVEVVVTLFPLLIKSEACLVLSRQPRSCRSHRSESWTRPWDLTGGRSKLIEVTTFLQLVLNE